MRMHAAAFCDKACPVLYDSKAGVQVRHTINLIHQRLVA
jgi:hypothetical protein